jgi:predicted RNase H-like HicB family nuclease
MKYTVKWSDEDDCYIATSSKYSSVKTHGDSEEEAIEELRIVMEEIEECLLVKEKNK